MTVATAPGSRPFGSVETGVDSWSLFESDTPMLHTHVLKVSRFRLGGGDFYRFFQTGHVTKWFQLNLDVNGILIP